MLHFLPWRVRGFIAAVLMGINTVVLCSVLLIVAFFKFVIPLAVWQRACEWMLIGIASFWVNNNALVLKLMHRIEWKVGGIENVSEKEWYLVISNHQSWADIIVLQTIFRGKIPFLKFFLKKELIWVPFLGLAWWALDFPFMKRYSNDFLKKHPSLKGKDIEITKKACRKFKTKPVSIMNFVEGTRFTKAKHEKQNSPYRNLLRPKAGGIAFVLGAMGEYLNSLVNVTISYPHGAKNFIEFICGKVTHIDVQVEITPITEDLLGDYFNDSVYRERFQEWVNRLWEKKDQDLDGLLLQRREQRPELVPDAIAAESIG
ncbi:MAG: acyltransferase [Pseudomonadota bacterium]